MIEARDGLQGNRIRLDPQTRSTLEGWLRASTTEQRYVKRARIVLLAAEGTASRAIAREVGVMTGVVSSWRKRFAASGIDGLKYKPRPAAAVSGRRSCRQAQGRIASCPSNAAEPKFNRERGNALAQSSWS